LGVRCGGESGVVLWWKISGVTCVDERMNAWRKAHHRKNNSTSDGGEAVDADTRTRSLNGRKSE
jgi:hypothetical protein